MVTNNTNNSIKIDSQESTNTIYGLNDKDMKYIAFNNENMEEELIIRPTQTKILRIKFSKIFNVGERINKIYFEDVISNYDKYKNLEDKSYYTEKLKIKLST